MFTLLFFIQLAIASSAAPKEDNTALSFRLVQDGHYQRASSVLDLIEPEKVTELRKYHTTVALLALHRADFAKAIQSFQIALQSPPSEAQSLSNENISSWLAQAFLDNNQPEKVLEILPQTSDKDPYNAIIGAKALYQLKRWPELWTFLQEKRKSFPHVQQLAELEIQLCLQLGMHHQATKHGLAYLLMNITEKDVLRVAFYFQNHDNRDGARSFLHMARLRFFHESIWKNAAALSFEGQHYVEAGQILQVLSSHHPMYAIPAAEAYRQAGQIDRAIRLNELAPAGKKKIQQRLGLLLEKQDFERAIALVPRLKRHRMLQDDALRYAIGYAYYQLGKYSDSLQQISKITDTRYFEQAVGLQQAIHQCLEEGCG